MNGRRYRVTVSGARVGFKGSRWFYNAHLTGGREDLTASEVSRVKREADRIGAKCVVRPVSGLPSRPRKARAGKRSKRDLRAQQLKNLAKGRKVRAANLKKRNR